VTTLESSPVVARDFVVKESAVINFIIAGLFSAIFIYSVVHPLGKGLRLQVYSFSLIPALLFIYKGIYSKTEILINASGIFTYGRLMTDWAHFSEAKVVHDEVVFSISDNWRLLVTYSEGNKIYREKIVLKNTHNKAEEEIIEAIRSFYQLHQDQALLTNGTM
jgi:hypothetical protein